MAESLEFIVDECDAGQRLDLFLTRRSGLTRARTQRLIEDGRVLANGHPQKPRHAVVSPKFLLSSLGLNEVQWRKKCGVTVCSSVARRGAS